MLLGCKNHRSSKARRLPVDWRERLALPLQSNQIIGHISFDKKLNLTIVTIVVRFKQKTAEVG